MSDDRKDFDANVREVMKTRQGQEVMWEILGFCGLYDDKFTGDSNTFYLEGKRAIGLQILDMLEMADPTIYARLLLDKQKTKDLT